MLQEVIYQDLGTMEYQRAWDYQEQLVKEKVLIKSEARKLAGIQLQPSWQGSGRQNSGFTDGLTGPSLPTINHLLFCEHPAVYTLGKSGSMQNVLLTTEEMDAKEIEFFNTNRGGDITFHGLQQVVGYPILDLEKFYTDIGKYLRDLEEVIIRTIAQYGIKGDRTKGETGVWIDPDVNGRERKICAMGIRCSRWITMHGFALNVNTDLSYFENIIPCGIQNKQVTSIEKELKHKVDIEEVKGLLKINFGKIFNVDII